MRKTIPVIIILMIFTLFPATDVQSHDVSNITQTTEKNSEYVIEFQDAGYNLTNIYVRKNNNVTTAIVNITTLPHTSYPSYLSLDVGEQNDVWKYESTGHGSFGHQTMFKDGDSSKTLDFQNPCSMNVSFLLPKSIVSSAEINTANTAPAPVFRMSTYVNVNFNITSLTMGDINNDGKTDFVCGAENGVFVFRNDGDLNFTQYNITEANTNCVAVSDFNNDGKKDLVAAGGSGVFVFRNNNNFNFTLSSALITTSTKSVGIGDFNNDGKKDIVVGGSDGVFVFRNDGNLNFTQYDITETNTNCVAVSDFNNDGKKDIVIGGSNGASIFKNNGGLIFTEYSLSSSATNSIYCANLNNDGLFDIIGLGDSFYIAKNNDNFFFSLTTIESASNLTAVSAEDIDQDGDSDLICSSSDGNIYMFQNQGGIQEGDIGTFTTPTCVNAGDALMNIVTTGDIDNDGDKDILGGNSSGVCVFTNIRTVDYEYEMSINDNFFWSIRAEQPLQDASELFSLGSPFFSLTLADLDNDGDLDVVGGNLNGFSIKYNENGTFNYTTSITMDMGIQSIKTVDLNNDGNVDIVGAGRNGNICVLFNNGGINNFTTANITASSSNLMSIDVADLDNDGGVDIIAGGIGSGTIYIAYSNNNFANTTPVSTSLGSVYSLKANDVDNDGDVDIVCGEGYGGRCYLLKNMNNSSFEETLISTGTSNYRYYTELADVDNDGDLDIVIVDNKNLRVAVNNNGVFETYQVDGLNVDVKSISIGDIDNDGDMDVVGGLKNGNFYLSKNENGQLTKFECISSSTSNSIFSTVLGDIDNDGDLDLLGGANTDGKVYMSKNEKNVFSQTVNLQTNDVFQKYINKSSVENKTMFIDEWNNSICMIPLTVTSKHAGMLFLNDVDIKYNYTAVTNDVSGAINNYVSYHGTNSVPLNFTSGSAGKIEWGINLVYNAPWLLKNIEDIAFNEDGTGVIDLKNYFDDNTGAKNLDYTVYNPDTMNMSTGVSSGVLTFIPKADWYGNITLRVKATDNGGYWCESNNFTVKVNPINDIPIFVHLPSSLSAKENVTRWWNITSNLYDVDNPLSQLTITTTDPTHITVHNINHTLEILYQGYGYSQTVKLTVSDLEPLSSSADVTINVLPYGTPTWSPIPVLYTDEDVNITVDNENIDLNDYVSDEDTPKKDLIYNITQQDNPCINVSIVAVGDKDLICVNIEPNYFGETNVTVTVSDGVFSDNTTFKVIVNPVNDIPVYLGGLTDATIYFNQTWSKDLDDYFYDVEDNDKLNFECNYPFDISIDKYNAASWSPLLGAKNLTNVVFTAFDSEGANMSSLPINLCVVEKPGNTPPVYNATLTDVTLEANMMWSINLDEYFYDAESQGLLVYYCSYLEIKFNGSTAYWCPTENDIGVLSNVVFTAMDPEDTNLTASSTPINITVTGKPLAVIRYISPKSANEGDEVFFSGEGKRGVIVAYEWGSDMDGQLSNNASFSTSTLSVGVHTISFRVQSSNGLWSDEVNQTIEIKKPAGSGGTPPLDLRLPYFITAMIFIIMGIILTLLRLRK